MSPHVEFWGIPSPEKEHSRPRETDFPLDDSETANASNSRLLVLNVECSEGEVDFRAESFE